MSNVDIQLQDSAWEGVEPDVQALLDRWLVADGATVQAGQAVARIVLVKSTMEVQAPAAGVLHVRVAEGATFARGQALGQIAAAA